MNIIRYSIRSFFTNEYYLIIRFASKRLFVATLVVSRVHQFLHYLEKVLYTSHISTRPVKDYFTTFNPGDALLVDHSLASTSTPLIATL